MGSARRRSSQAARVASDSRWRVALAVDVTERVRLATGVNILPQTNPLLFAKPVASLDFVSNGRFLLGVGIGWLAEEFAALGVPFGRRGARYGDGWYAPTANLKQPAALLPLLEGVDVVQRYEGLGVSRLVIPLPALAATGGAIAGIRRFADEVLSKVG
jgi:alkanesulfonate monooxygenase SsuD/methylene tetrahydromethanopterin reductase-like flavin-dependent oxidoreductase (luciferase family)